MRADRVLPAGHSTQRNGSDQAADFIGSSTGEGSIGYDEYAYALNDDIPVVKLLNAAGYYTLPSPSNVAIALQKAQINENPSSPDFLMQDLDSVYGYTDPRTYPLSSYSYLIVPRDKLSGKQGPPPSFTTGKGTTLSTWMNYVLCGAQQKAGNLGYSPLPKNLVVGGFQQVDHIPGHIATPDLTQLNNCDNPTYHNGVNYLIKDAAMPSPCDYKTAPLACKVVDGKAAAAGGAGSGSGGRSGTSAAGSGSNAAGGGTGAAGTANAGGGGSGGGPGGPGGSAINPLTGQAESGGASQDTDVNAEPVAAIGLGGDDKWLFAVLTGLALVIAIAVPSTVGPWLQRRRRRV